jgi:Transposase and inactivated derivatives, IS30 family
MPKRNRSAAKPADKTADKPERVYKADRTEAPAPEHVLRARLSWVRMYQETGDAGLTCRRCGISYPTLRKWRLRYLEAGEAGLRSRSRRPHKLPPPKVTQAHEELILKLRRERRIGPKRIQYELNRLHGIHFSTGTIWRVLHKYKVPSLRRQSRSRRSKRYSRPVPGDRVQIDSCKVGPGLYQFTAVDDCTRWRVLGLYPARTEKSALHFLKERVLAEFPFPIQRIQTDRGGEFFGLRFQIALKELKIKFRPIRPRSPHLNGKVERSQLTDKVEFWPTVELTDPDLAQKQSEWQAFYNERRPHTSLGYRPPSARLTELSDLIPTWEQVRQLYDEDTEPFRERDSYWDIDLKDLKNSVQRSR